MNAEPLATLPVRIGARVRLGDVEGEVITFRDVGHAVFVVVRLEDGRLVSIPTTREALAGAVDADISVRTVDLSAAVSLAEMVAVGREPHRSVTDTMTVLTHAVLHLHARAGGGHADHR